MIILIYWGIPVLVFIGGIIAFISNRKHLLSILLSLEFIVLGLFLLLFIFLSYYNSGGSFSILFLTFTVCEGALGLSLLVSLIRSHGNDYFQSFRVLQC